MEKLEPPETPPPAPHPAPHPHAPAPQEPAPQEPGPLEQAAELLPLPRREPFLARLIRELGGMVLLGARALTRAFRRPLGLGDVAYQVEMFGVKSLSIALLTAIFAGLVITLQFAVFMSRFGVLSSVGRVVVLTLFRELGPVLTALTVGSRIGSGITAELGSMKVTEQLDAIRALGADPIKKLVTPRILACLLIFPVLTTLADVVGVLAGSWVMYAEYGFSYQEFYRSVVTTATLLDFTSGVGKSVVFGGIIGIVGCYKGFNVQGGTEGVGRATTETVAITSVVICLTDFFLTKLFLSL